MKFRKIRFLQKDARPRSAGAHLGAFGFVKTGFCEKIAICISSSVPPINLASPQGGYGGCAAAAALGLFGPLPGPLARRVLGCACAPRPAVLRPWLRFPRARTSPRARVVRFVLVGLLPPAAAGPPAAGGCAAAFAGLRPAALLLGARGPAIGSPGARAPCPPSSGVAALRASKAPPCPAAGRCAALRRAIPPPVNGRAPGPFLGPCCGPPWLRCAPAPGLMGRGCGRAAAKGKQPGLSTPFQQGTTVATQILTVSG